MSIYRSATIALLTILTVAGGAVEAGATLPGDVGAIAYGADGLAGHSIRTIHPDGLQGRLLWPTHTWVGHGAEAASPFDVEWSPDGETLAMALMSGTLGHDRIVLMDLDTGVRTTIFRITQVSPGGDDLIVSLAFSPSGDTLMFCTAAISGGAGLRLFRIGANGAGLTSVSGHHDCAADWSSTDRIVATSEAGAGSSIVTMDPDGSNRQTVAALTGRYSLLLAMPSWSPDGTTIVYAAPVNHHFDLFSIRADGSGRINLTDTREREEALPLFSPDGTEIAYARTRRFPRRSAWDLFAMSADGLNRRRLTDTPRRSEFTLSWRPLPI